MIKRKTHVEIDLDLGFFSTQLVDFREEEKKREFGKLINCMNGSNIGLRCRKSKDQPRSIYMLHVFKLVKKTLYLSRDGQKMIIANQY